MKFLLDTNALIHFASGNEAIVDRVSAYKKSDIGTSVVAQTEFAISLFGPGASKKDKVRFDDLFSRFKPAVYTSEDAVIAARIIVLNKLEKEHAIYRDMMIAAQALRLGATVVTQNTADFYRGAKGAPKLKVEDWTIAI